MYYSAVQYNSVQACAAKKNAAQYGAVECSTVQSAIPFHSVSIESDITLRLHI